MIAWVLCVLALSGPASELEDSVDLIELNHFHDEAGNRVYDQVIFYEWRESRGKWLVRAWLLVEPKEIITRQPYETSHDHRFHVRWYDADQKAWRHVTSHQFKPTWSQVDPERANKKLLDERLRNRLVERLKAEVSDGQN